MSDDSSSMSPVRRSAGRPSKIRIEEMERGLLDTARSVFLQRGYAAATLNEIAAIAGASKRTIYSRYASKAELFEAAISDFIAQRFMPLEVGATEGRSARERLVHFGRILSGITFDPETVAVHRAVAAEQARFPDLIARLHRLGHERVTARVGAELDTLHAQHPRRGCELFYAMFVLAPLQAAADGDPDSQTDIPGMVDIVLHAAGCIRESTSTDPAKMSVLVQSHEAGNCRTEPPASVDEEIAGHGAGVLLSDATGAPGAPRAAVGARSAAESGIGNGVPHRRADALGNRSKLLDAAEAVFLESGVNVSLDLVAERAGVGRATLFRNFADRRALINSLLERSLDELEREAAALPRDALALGRLLHFIAARIVARAPLTEFWLTSGYDDPAVRAALARFTAVIEQPVAWAVAGGACRADLVASDVFLLVSMFSGVLYAQGAEARLSQLTRAWRMACEAAKLHAPPFLGQETCASCST